MSASVTPNRVPRVGPFLPSVLVASFLVTPSLLTSLRAAEPLHQQIDRLMLQQELFPAREETDHLEYTRRVYLDLVGRIPSIEESQTELAQSENASRREQLAEQLVSSDEFPRHMARVFDVLFMERRGGSHVKTDDFREWLRQSFAADKPYPQIVAEMLGADVSNGLTPPAAFVMERGVESTLLTRDIGRIFFGADMQCAQCHDHPLVDDYRMDDYHGISAFVSRLSLFQPDKKKPGTIAETADG
ncbi:MAG: DUF1549 domain-containing protein, partial [Planctomycetaceae bacterium]|nr:DUF1549 domain-containing protein [Planctomycetaceae bacterium]